jgi:hypothetical protein
MNQLTSQRRCLGTAAVAVALIAVTACSGGGSTAKPDHPTTAAPSSAPTKAAAAAPDPAALAALGKAESLTKALHSYAFRASQQLSGGAKVQQTVLTGRAIRPGAVSYDLSVGGKHQQVIKVGGHTFVRVPPGAWKALSKPGPTVDPIASLLPLLANLSEPALSGLALTGKVPATVLSKAGLAPAGAAPSAATPVRFALDAAGHVTAVTLRLTVKAGTQTLVLDEITSFTQFNKVAAIKAPGTIK